MKNITRFLYIKSGTMVLKIFYLHLDCYMEDKLMIINYSIVETNSKIKT
jgi:hypothetical protein